MKIKKVFFKDFMALGDTSIDLEDRGLVSMSGVNTLNPSANNNGAGKSSIAEGICWCVWGKTDRNLASDDVIRAGSKKAMVRIIMSEGDVTYEIQRTRMKGKGSTEFFQESKDGRIELTKGTEALTQAEIENTLGISANSFGASMVMGQKNLVSLPELNDRSLKEIVEEAAGLQDLAPAFETAKAEYREKTAHFQAASSEYNLNKSLFEHKSEALKAAIERTKEARDRKEKSLVEFENEMAEYEADLAEMKKLLNFNVSDVNLAEAKKKVEAKIQGLAEANKQYEAWLSSRVAASTNLSSKESELTRAATLAERKKQEIDKALGEAGKPCPTCGTKMDSSHVEEFVKSLSKEWAVLKKEHKKIESEVEDLRKDLSEISENKIEKISGEALFEKLNKINQEESRRNSIRLRIEEKTKRPPRYVEVTVPTYEKEKEEAKKAKSLALKSREAMELAQSEMEIAAEVASVFDVSGVRALILDKVTPFLNERTAEYLAALTDGVMSVEWTTLSRKKDGTMKEKFGIEVVNTFTGKGYKSCSGGECKRISLACSFALQDLVASRAEKPVGLMIADEIDSAMDESGLERLMSVLEDKARDKGTVLVISHNNLKSWISNSMTVVSGKDGSKIIND